MIRLARAAALLAVVLGSAAVPARADVVLRYAGRYDTQSEYHDHLMGVTPVGDHHALVCSNLDIVVVDLNALTVPGTQTYLDRLPGIDVYNVVTRGDGWVYANLRQGGFAVVRLELSESVASLTLVSTVAEPGVFFEKMAIAGNRLYVPAHAYGIRIYDLTFPASPVLIGSLEEGFDDAFAIDVAGDTAYVADGAGGLKIVDVSDPGAPSIVAGEDPAGAAGTALDVLVIDEHVHVACGGAGVATYPLAGVGGRVLQDTPLAARDLARVGDRLAVADIRGVEIYDVAPDGALTRVAGESGRRRSAGGEAITLRLWYGVAAWGDDKILVADWDSMDLYELVDPALDDQPDLDVSANRIRFAPAGGSATIEVSSDGSVPVTITGVTSTQPTFSVSPTSAVLAPGETLDLQIDYAGGQPGAGLILIASDDPDEGPMPIEVFGETSYLDPGEAAAPFTLQSWTYDHDTHEFAYGTFDLASYEGRVVFLHVFGLG